MLPVSNDYLGEIVMAELQESNGKMGAVVLCRPAGLQEVGRWFGSFSETVISRESKSKNAGRMVGEVTAETLGEFGCTDFAKIDVLIGQRVKFGIKHVPDREDPEKIWCEVNFIHPLRSKPASAAGLAGINRFRGAAIEAAKKAGAPPPKAGGQQQRAPQGQQQRQRSDADESGYDSYDNEADPFR